MTVDVKEPADVAKSKVVVEQQPLYQKTMKMDQIQESMAVFKISVPHYFKVPYKVPKKYRMDDGVKSMRRKLSFSTFENTGFFELDSMISTKQRFGKPKKY